MSEEANTLSCPEPKRVEYHPVTGVPEEFHEFLHKDSDEYKRLKSSAEASTSEVAEGVSNVSLQDSKPAEVAQPAVAEEVKPKKKKSKEKEIVITRAQRQRKKCVTSVEGMDHFGVKLADAAKVFGKKYACGASVVKNPSLREQIDIQGDVQELLPELILKQYGTSNSIEAKNVFMVIDKQKVQYEP